MPDNFPLMIPNATTNDGEFEVFAPYDRSLIATATAADSSAVYRPGHLHPRIDQWLATLSGSFYGQILCP